MLLYLNAKFTPTDHVLSSWRLQSFTNMHFWTESHLQQIRTQKLPVYRTERKNILNISRDYEQIPSRYKTFFFIPNTHVVITSKLQELRT